VCESKVLYPVYLVRSLHVFRTSLPPCGLRDKEHSGEFELQEFSKLSLSFQSIVRCLTSTGPAKFCASQSGQINEELIASQQSLR